MTRSPKKPTRPAAFAPQKQSSALVVHHSTQLMPGMPGERKGESWRAPPSHMLHELHMVWMQLRSEWNWIVVVPGDPGFSTSQLARALTDVGARLSAKPIDFIEATNVDLDNSAWLIGRLGTSAGDHGVFARQDQGQPGPAGWIRPVPRTIVALESPLENPLALPVALAADGVVLCVRRGQSSMLEVRRTVEAVGADRIACCVMID